MKCKHCKYWDNIGSIPTEGYCSKLSTLEGEDKNQLLVAYPECKHDGPATEVVTNQNFFCAHYKPNKEKKRQRDLLIEIIKADEENGLYDDSDVNDEGDLTITLKNTYIKRDTDLSTCKMCEEPIYGNMYQLAIETRVGKDITPTNTEGLDFNLCESCYMEINNPNKDDRD